MWQKSDTSEIETMKMVGQILSGLAHMHSKGVTHRDVNPSNIMRTEVQGKEKYKLIDLSLSGVELAFRSGEFWGQTNLSAPVGTPHYMSPEQFLEKVVVTVQTDLWSLGVVMFQCLDSTGRTPFAFDSTNWGIICNAVVEHCSVMEHCTSGATWSVADINEPPKLENVSMDVAQFVSKCLEKDLSKRFETALEMVARLESILAMLTQQEQESAVLSGCILHVEDSSAANDSSAQEPLRGRSKTKLILELLEEVKGIKANMFDINKKMDMALSGIEVVRTTMVTLDKSTIPSVFIIQLDGSMKTEVIERLKAGEVNGMTQKAKQSLLGRFKAIFCASAPIEAVQGAVDSFATKDLRLRLICQYTWQPVGEGYVIKAPRKSVPKLLPLAEAGLKAMKTVNGVSELGRLIGLPTPKIPESWVSDVEKLVDGLGAGNSPYQCIADALQDESTAGGDATTLSDFQLREFQLFLDEHDTEQSWQKVLTKVCTTDGETLWVSKDGRELLTAHGKLTRATPEVTVEVVGQALQRLSGPHALYAA
jgi:hypothetical protein